jgi:hypothetical protein
MKTLFAPTNQHSTWSVNRRWRAGLLLACSLVSAAGQALALTVTNVTTVNVTPAGFSVVFATSEPATPGLSVYADAGGVTNLAGLVGIEPLPLHTGNPTVIPPYQRRQSHAVIRQKTVNAGLGHVRVTGVRPNTTYYYRVRATGTNGQETLWPASGPLPSVTATTESAFVREAKQLVVNLPGGDSEGQLVTLAHANAAFPLAAVVGDGVGTNQVFFNLSDLIALVGGTNFIPVGSQQFDVQLLGPAGNGGSSHYSLNFTSAFAVADASTVDYGTNLTGSGVLLVALGSSVVGAGDNSGVPVSLAASSGLASVNFAFDVAFGHLTNFTVQTLSPVIQTATIQSSSPTRWQVTLTVRPGQSVSGTQQVAQINFTALAGQPSAFVPLQLAGIDGRHSDNSPFATQLGQSGRVTVVGEEPLLEAQFASGGGRSLVLYGKPAVTYQIQIAGSLGDSANWSDWTRVSLTNLSQLVPGVNPLLPISFFRAYEIGRPLLEIQFVAGSSPVLVLHGTAGSSYQVQTATSLSGGGNWTTWARVPLTGTSQVVPGVIPPGGAFFRAVEFVADPSLLDAQSAPNGGRKLILFGKSGSSYQIQVATGLNGGGDWANWTRVPMTNSFRILAGITPPSPVSFFRAQEFTADLPLLDAYLIDSELGSLVLYGQSGTSYQLQYATNLSGVVTWYPQLDYTLTSAFRIVNGLNPTNSLIIYRVIKP